MCVFLNVLSLAVKKTPQLSVLAVICYNLMKNKSRDYHYLNNLNNWRQNNSFVSLLRRAHILDNNTDIEEVYNQSLYKLVTISLRTKDRREPSFGSGFIVDISMGFAITSSHVLRGVHSCDVLYLNPGEPNVCQLRCGRVIYIDHKHDLALIQFKFDNNNDLIPSLTMLTPTKFGDQVVSLGFFDIYCSLTTGTVMCPLSTARDIRSCNHIYKYSHYVSSNMLLVEHTAEVPHGFSGGPLINTNGQLAGVHNMNRNTITYDIPVADIKAFIERSVGYYNKQEIVRKRQHSLKLGLDMRFIADINCIQFTKTYNHFGNRHLKKYGIIGPIDGHWIESLYHFERILDSYGDHLIPVIVISNGKPIDTFLHPLPIDVSFI